MGRRSIPLMKYIVKLREDGGTEKERHGQEGSSFKTKRVEERAKEKERLEAKPVITRLPGATAADCYLVSTPTTLSPAILLPSTY